MNVEQAILAIGNASGNELPTEALETVKAHWSDFYPLLEQTIDNFIADDTSVTDEQQSVLFFGTFLSAELKYTPALSKCLQLFSRSDTYLTPIEAVFGDTLTELTSTLFYQLGKGSVETLSAYIVDGHQAMYCKASAMEALFAQYETGELDKTEINQLVTRWLAAFIAIPSSINAFLLSVLADHCVTYQLDQFKAQFITLLDKNLIDEQRFSSNELNAWDSTESKMLIESGAVEVEFNLVDTLNAWLDDSGSDLANLLDDVEAGNHGLVNEGDDEFTSLIGEGSLLANMLYDENTILENSVPVDSLPTTGRNDPCLCGSGKKYKKCCLQ